MLDKFQVKNTEDRLFVEIDLSRGMTVPELINGMYRILCQKVALENNYEKYKESENCNAKCENGITGVDFDHSD